MRYLRHRWLLVLFIGLPIYLATGQQNTPKPSVLLITIDTLRADRLGCYGYAGAQTPAIDHLAAEGIQFMNAVSHVPLTRPSHTSIFSGLNPFETGVHDNIAPTLDKKIPLLAEAFQKQGYKTAAFVASFVINSQSGLNRGFDVYEDQFDLENQPTQFALNLEKRGGEVYEEFASWFNQNKRKSYFAWVHLYDPHFPYEPPKPYLQRFQNHPYDGEVAYSDEVISRIVKLIDSNTLLILTSDHGESLGDHGEGAHSYYIYDATLHVPMIFHWPQKLPSGKKINMQARLIDLYPTILDLLQIPIPKPVTGISLKPWLMNPEKEDPLHYSYCETLTPWLHFGWSPLQGVRAGGWKYIDAPRSELYQLTVDPGELKNTIQKEGAKAKQLKQWLIDSKALGVTVNSAANATQELDPEMLEKLASLGYAGVPSVPATPAGKLADPKDKLADFKLFNQLIREGIEDFQTEKYAQAAAKFQQLRDKKVPSFEVYYYLGRSQLRLKSYDRARTELKLAIQKLPFFLPAYNDLAEAFEATGDLKKAEEALLAGLTIVPNSPILVQPLAWFYQKQKNYGAAEKLLIAELKDHPDDLESRFRLSAIYRDTNRSDLALAQLKEIVSRKPDQPEAYNQMGMLYGGKNQLKDALQQFQKAAALNPGNELYQRNVDLATSRLAEKNTPASSQMEPIRFRIIQTPSLAAGEILVRKLKAGESWDGLAADYSIHSSARSTQPVIELVPSEIELPILQSLEKLKPGQFSGVVQTSRGFFIVKRE
jgi:choline-sulfatase